MNTNKREDLGRKFREFSRIAVEFVLISEISVARFLDLCPFVFIRG